MSVITKYVTGLGAQYPAMHGSLAGISRIRIAFVDLDLASAKPCACRVVPTRLLFPFVARGRGNTAFLNILLRRIWRFVADGPQFLAALAQARQLMHNRFLLYKQALRTWALCCLALPLFSLHWARFGQHGAFFQAFIKQSSKAPRLREILTASRIIQKTCAHRTALLLSCGYFTSVCCVVPTRLFLRSAARGRGNTAFCIDDLFLVGHKLTCLLGTVLSHFILSVGQRGFCIDAILVVINKKTYPRLPCCPTRLFSLSAARGRGNTAFLNILPRRIWCLVAGGTQFLAVLAQARQLINKRFLAYKQALRTWAPCCLALPLFSLFWARFGQHGAFFQAYIKRSTKALKLREILTTSRIIRSADAQMIAFLLSCGYFTSVCRVVPTRLFLRSAARGRGNTAFLNILPRRIWCLVAGGTQFLAVLAQARQLINKRFLAYKQALRTWAPCCLALPLFSLHWAWFGQHGAFFQAFIQRRSKAPKVREILSAIRTVKSAGTQRITFSLFCGYFSSAGRVVPPRLFLPFAARGRGNTAFCIDDLLLVVYKLHSSMRPCCFTYLLSGATRLLVYIFCINLYFLCRIASSFRWGNTVFCMMNFNCWFKPHSLRVPCCSTYLVSGATRLLY